MRNAGFPPFDQWQEQAKLSSSGTINVVVVLSSLQLFSPSGFSILERGRDSHCVPPIPPPPILDDLKIGKKKLHLISKVSIVGPTMALISPTASSLKVGLVEKRLKVIARLDSVQWTLVESRKYTLFAKCYNIQESSAFFATPAM